MKQKKRNKAKKVRAVCIICKREYSITMRGLDYIMDCKIDNICPYCDKTHDVEGED